MGDLESTGFLMAVSSVIGGLLTLIFTKGMDAYSKWRAEQRTDDKIEDDKSLKGYEFVIGELKGRLDRTESRLATVEGEHIVCIRNHERLSAENSLLKRDMERMNNEIETLKSRTRP